MKNVRKPAKANVASEFYRRFKKQMLNMHTEHRVIAIALGATAVFVLIFALNIYDMYEKSFNPFFIMLTGAYVFELGYIYFVSRKLKAELLSGDNLYNVSEVAEMCGYCEPLYFSRVFKKTYGVSPLSYAKGLRRKN